MRVIRQSRPGRDRIELDAIEELLKSGGWQLVAEKLRAMVQQEERRLRSVSPEDLRVIQERIITLENALRVPELLTKEIGRGMA